MVKEILNTYLEIAEDRFSALTKTLHHYNIDYSVITHQGDTIRNVIVELNGCSITDNHIVINAHYDVWPGSLGINDNACAVAALIDFIIKCKDKTLNENIVIAFFDKEEQLFKGSAAYINKYKPLIKYSLVFDIVGYGEHLYYSNSYKEMNTLLKSCDLRSFNQNLPADSISFTRANIPNSLIVALDNNDVIARNDNTFDLVNMYKVKTFTTFHNGKLDNDISIINFSTVQKVSDLLTGLFIKTTNY